MQNSIESTLRKSKCTKNAETHFVNAKTPFVNAKNMLNYFLLVVVVGHLSAVLVGTGIPVTFILRILTIRIVGKSLLVKKFRNKILILSEKPLNLDNY